LSTALMNFFMVSSPLRPKLRSDQSERSSRFLF
jgi:hypothetical protein